MLVTKQRSNGNRARHALVKEIVMCEVKEIVMCEATENVILPAACCCCFVFAECCVTDRTRTGLVVRSLNQSSKLHRSFKCITNRKRQKKKGKSLLELR